MAASWNSSHGLLARTNAWLRSHGLVLYSTPASVRAQWPSLLACLEIAIAVTIYWWIAIRFDTHKHLWVSICVAPLLLLRSKESIAVGVKWFTAYMEERNYPVEEMPNVGALPSSRRWAFIGLSVLAGTTLSYLLARLWVIDHEGWPLFWRSSIIGWLSLNAALAAPIAVWRGSKTLTSETTCAGIAGAALGAVVGSGASVVAAVEAAFAAALAAIVGWPAVAVSAGANLVPPTVSGALMLAGSLLLFGWLYAFSLRALWTRFLATLCHLPAGVAALPANWSRTLFSTDIAHQPELVPGYIGDSEINFNYLYRKYKRSPDWDHEKTFRAFLICLYFFPTYVYRLSIKSTFWLYWPLVYIADDTRGETRPVVLFDKLSGTACAWFSALSAATTLVAFFAANFLAHFGTLWPAVQVAFQVAAIEFLFQLDWASQKPWLWFSLASAAISLCLFFWAGQMKPELKHGDIDAATRVKIFRHALWMKRVARLGRVCTTLLILSLLIFFLLWRSPLQCVLGEYGLNHILTVFRWYYGPYMPQGPTCG